jgi:hypothetical protein
MGLVRRLLIALCLSAVTACADSPTIPTPVNQEVILAPGQTVNISGADLNLRFEGVLADSRCPANAICIWAGDAHVRIQVQPRRGSNKAYDLHTADNRPVTHDDVTIELTQLLPYPFTTDPIDPAAYRATLKVTRWAATSQCSLPPDLSLFCMSASPPKPSRGGQPTHRSRPAVFSSFVSLSSVTLHGKARLNS